MKNMIIKLPRKCHNMKHSLPEALEKKRRGTNDEKIQEHSYNYRHTSEGELKQWNSVKYLEISVPRHIRFAELRKK